MRYFDVSGTVMPSDTFRKALEASDIEPAKVLSYSQTFELLEQHNASEADFKWAVQELRDEQARRLTGTAIAESMEILERGYEVDRDFLKGHSDARKYLAGKLSAIEHLGAVETTPEGDILLEGKSILADYLSRKNGQKGRGIKLGVPNIDDQTGGHQKGELVLVAGPPGTGKSMVSTQAAWHAAVEQKQNVFFATSETVRDQVIRRILARHSRLPQFGRPGGLNSADIKKGMLSEDDERVFGEVVHDWTHNRDYGKLHVLQVPRGATLAYVESRLKDFGRENECGLVVIDYLALLKAETRRGSEREELNDILKGAKLVATSFDDGNGVPIMSPWQINREGQKGSAAQGHYTMAALSDTSEAERSADCIITLYREQEDKTDMRVQFLKMRDDDLPPMSFVSIDFRSTYIGANQAPTITNLHNGSDFDFNAELIQELNLG